MAGILEHLAGMAGETLRIKKANKTPIAPENIEYVNAITNAAQNGDVSAMQILGNHYHDGKYVNYNPELAIYWWTEAAKRNDATSQYNLGLIYNGDLSNLYYNEEKAAYWLELAARNGYKDAEVVLQEEYKWSNFRNKWVHK